jgi:hypothetical protein
MKPHRKIHIKVFTYNDIKVTICITQNKQETKAKKTQQIKPILIPKLRTYITNK